MLKWIVISNQPFSVVEEEEFAEMIDTLNPSAELMTRNTVKADIMATYWEKIEKIKTELKTIPGKMSVSLDIWTSKNVIPFLVIRGHWLSPEWEYRSQLLDFAEMTGDHDGVNICKFFLRCIHRLDFPLKRILAFTMDNASNNNTFMDSLATHAADMGLPISSLENQIRCSAHIFNLIVQDILQSLNVNYMLELINEIVDEMEGVSISKL